MFAHGTSNPWGLDFDTRGQAIIEACVIPHLFHMVQGGRYQRQAGTHFNPYTYDDIKTIADHRHFLGGTPHGGNGRSDAAGGGHAHSGLMIYQGESWPEKYRGGYFMNNIHGARINMEIPERAGSGLVAKHGGDFIRFNDRASQIVRRSSSPCAAGKRLVSGADQFRFNSRPMVSVERRGGDSNPRYPCEYAALAKRCFRPLSHLSILPAPRG